MYARGTARNFLGCVPEFSMSMSFSLRCGVLFCERDCFPRGAARPLPRGAGAGTTGRRAGDARCPAGAVKKLRRSVCPLGGAPAMAPAGEHGQSKKLAGFGSYRRGFFFGFGFSFFFGFFLVDSETFPAADAGCEETALTIAYRHRIHARLYKA
jgi:hypothetical protein